MESVNSARSAVDDLLQRALGHHGLDAVLDGLAQAIVGHFFAPPVAS